MNRIFARPRLGIISFCLCVFTAVVLSAPDRVRAASASGCEFNGVQRIVAIGDVHGAFDRLTGILTAAGLTDTKGSWIGGRTHLVQLGDIVDRGPDSRKALDLLHRLDGEAARSGGAVHMLLGNHEVARILGDLRFATPGEYAAFASSDSEALRERFMQTTKVADRDEFLKRTPLGQLEMRAAFGRRGNYEWVRRLDTVVRINGVLFVHGGISPAIADFSCEQINSTVRKELSDDLDKTREAPLASLVAREDGPLWYRGLAQLPDGDETAFNDLLGRLHARAIVIAHTVTIDGRTHARFNGRLFQIDTGMQPAYAQGGRASALEIVGDAYTAIYEDRRDALTASGDHRQ
jgi:calcineurin-like phosphoesterase family protein